MKELSKEKGEDPREVTNKLINKTKENSNQNEDNLNPLHFTEHMSTNYRRGWYPELEKIQVNRQFKREVREIIVRSTKGKETGRDELVVKAVQADLVH